MCLNKEYLWYACSQVSLLKAVLAVSTTYSLEESWRVFRASVKHKTKPSCLVRAGRHTEPQVAENFIRLCTAVSSPYLETLRKLGVLSIAL